MMGLFWTPQATQDRDEIHDYIEADNPVAALALDELFSEKASRLVDHLARISHHPSAADADPLAVTGRTPSSRLDVVSATPAPSSGPCAPPQRRLDALATKCGEKCGLGLGRPGRVADTRELVAHRHYAFVYDVAGDLVRILRLLHTARQWPMGRG